MTTEETAEPIVLKAIREPVNVFLLTILLWTSFLTQDSFLFWATVFVEIAYLAWAPRCLWLKERHTCRKGHVEGKRLALLYVSVSGVVIVLFVVFYQHVLTYRFSPNTHAESWEAGALLWTASFIFYYFAKVQRTAFPWVNTIICSFLFGFILTMWWLAWNSLSSFRHVLFVGLISLSLLLSDALLWLYSEDKVEKTASYRNVLLADVPTVLAFAVLVFYVWFHDDAEQPGVFLSGAISFQLLFSNLLVILIETDLIPTERSGERCREVLARVFSHI